MLPCFRAHRRRGRLPDLICKPLREPNITARQVLAAPDACALGIEIVASRIADWKIQLVDTIADNASYGGFTLGPWDKKLRDSDLSALAMSIRKNGALAGEGLGSAVLGNPAIAAAWLANKLVNFGVSLEPGNVVISGVHENAAVRGGRPVRVLAEHPAGLDRHVLLSGAAGPAIHEKTVLRIEAHDTPPTEPNFHGNGCAAGPCEARK